MTKTTFLKLILPLNGEFRDTWDEALNPNFQDIDAWADVINTEIIDARFGQLSLKDFLTIGLNNDGTLKPTTEVVRSRDSFLYGDEDGSGDFDLPKRLNLGDTEVFRAREGLPSLRESIGFHNYMKGAVLDGTKDVNNYPSWLGMTGANAQIDGSVTNVLMLIGGQKARIRTLEQIAITGGAGTKYLYAFFSDLGTQTVDGDSGTPPPASPNGSCGADLSTKVRIFEDTTIDFTAVDVKVGDVLTILGSGANAGDYQIRAVAPGGNVNRLQIFGTFPGGVLASLDYIITDPFAPTLGFDAAKVAAPGKFYFGEADFDGAVVTATRALPFEDVFVGEWRAVDVVGTPSYEEVWNHNLFDDRLEVSIQASQANDGSAAVMPLDTGSLTNSLSLNFTNNLSFDPGTFNAGMSGATYSPLPSLTGTVASSLTGDVTLDNAVRVQFTQTQISVKNPVSGVFYTDYTGVVKTTGFIRVIVRRKA